LKVENAALQESMANLEHLTASVHRLRASLLKVRVLNTPKIKVHNERFLIPYRGA